MPYGKWKGGEQICVYKKDADGNRIGASLGCHATEDAADAQIAALYANETRSEDVQYFSGGLVRAVGNGIVEGLLVPFNTPDNPDWYGTYFDANTDYVTEDFPPLRAVVLYDHGLDETLNIRNLGTPMRAKFTDAGLWFQAQLKLRDEWEQEVYKLAEDGKLGWSSGALPQSVEVAEDGHIERWAIIDATLTPRPAAVPYASQIYTRSAYQRALQAATTGTDLKTLVKRSESALPLSTDKRQENPDMDAEKLQQIAAMVQEAAQMLIEYANAAQQQNGGEPMPPEVQQEMANELNTAMNARIAEMEEALAEMSEDKRQMWVDQELAKALPEAIKAYEKRKAERAAQFQNAARDAYKQVEPKPAPGYVGGNGATTVNQVGRAAKPGLGDFVRGIYHKDSSFRAQNPYVGPLGGYMLGQEIAPDILDPLTAEVTMFDMGVQQTRVSGVGTYTVNKMTAAPSAYRPGINQAITDDEATFGTVTAFLRPIAAEVIIPRQLLMQTSLPIDQKIRDQAIRAIKLQIDKEILVGEGVVNSDTGAEIRGILRVLEGHSTLSSTNVITLATNGRMPKFTDLTAAETQVATGNVKLDGDTSGWVMHPRTRGTFRSLTTTTGEPLLHENYSQKPYEDLVGYKVGNTTQVPINITTGTNTDTSYIFLGNFMYGEYVMSNDVEVIVDEMTLAGSLQVRLIFYTYSDFIMHYPEAFYVMKGVRAS
jgi:HK97 family phage major capsid protein